MRVHNRGRKSDRKLPIKIEPYAASENEPFFSGQKARDERRNLMNKPLCAIDSEGKTIDKRHRLTLLQALWAKGKAQIAGEDLSTLDCLNFLHNKLPRNHVYVIYASTYDFSNWLCKIPLAALVELFQTNCCTAGRFGIKLVPGKFLQLKCNECRWNIIIYDVFSYWQVSFLKACEEWDVGTQEQRELIRVMKELRGNFANVDEAKIQEYCWLELELLIDLVNKLRTAILLTPYRPKGLYGPGALAQAILTYHNVTEYYGPYDRELALLSYYGGRFDTALFGWFEHVFQHDIRSAYPDQIRNLPCLRHAHWQDSTDPTSSRYGFYRVKWNVGENCPFPPFPWRDEKGCIWYPYKAEGWYHADEVRAAIEVFGRRKIRVLEGKALIEGCDHRPFSFVDDLYQWRLRLVAEGNAEQGRIVKLGLNSLYGKMVQSVGNKDKPPPFQNFFYGGAITAGTRAKILRAIKDDMNIVISIATDGIVAMERLNHLIEGKQLGEWEIDELLLHIQISNGVYYSISATKGEIEKTRGIGKHTIDWNKLETIYREHGPLGVYQYVLPARFRTLQDAIRRNDLVHACQWIEEDRVLQLQPSRRFTLSGENVDGFEPPYKLGDKLQFRFEPLAMPGLSHPFKPKQTWDQVHALRAIYNLPQERDIF